MTVEAQQQRQPGGTGRSGLPSARLLVAVAVCVLGLESGPALAQGSRPEPAPIKAPVKLGPEPAPAASAAPTIIASTNAPAPSTSQRSPATTSRPSVVVAQPRSTASSRTKPKRSPPVLANPKSTNAVKAIPDAIPRSATRVAVGAVPAGSGDSNQLLFLGGLALLALVLSDAALLGFTARVLREPADR